MFKKIVIVGTGLIGGSLGLALKDKALSKEIIGTSRRRANVLLARKMGAIDRAVFSLNVVREADLLVLAAPVNAIIDSGKQIAKLLKPDCIVIDVASTKQMVVEELDGLLPNFVGCHPLAGLEKNGVAFARKDIFNNSVCILTPTEKTDKNALRKVRSMWKRLGVKVFQMTPEDHDTALGFTSHLPHAVAFSLKRSLPREYIKFCAGGFKDTTRIAASNAQLWSEIFLSNRKCLLEAIKVFESNLSELKSAVVRNDRKSLVDLLGKSHENA